MLAVEPNSEFRQPPCMQSQQEVEDFTEPEITVQKQVSKKPLITPFRIMLGLAIFFLLIVGSYKLYSVVAPSTGKSAIQITNDNIRTVAGSSSQNGKSSSGSSSSKSSKNSDKPKEPSQPAGKDVIANTPLGSDEEGDGEDEDKNNGDKNKKILDDGKNADGVKSGKGDTSTDQDDDEESLEEESDEANAGGLVWPQREDDQNTPLIGSTRK